jgi:hypothetical protein
METPALRRDRLDGLKNIACAFVVAIPLGAGAVMAASEALQPAPGNAVAVRRGSVGHCQDAVNPAASGMSWTRVVKVHVPRICEKPRAGSRLQVAVKATCRGLLRR